MGDYLNLDTIALVQNHPRENNYLNGSWLNKLQIVVEFFDDSICLRYSRLLTFPLVKKTK